MRIMTDMSRSRAMAVAAHEGRIYIYALKSMNEMRAEFKENSQLGPIKEVSNRSVWPVHDPRLKILSL